MLTVWYPEMPQLCGPQFLSTVLMLLYILYLKDFKILLNVRHQLQLFMLVV